MASLNLARANECCHIMMDVVKVQDGRKWWDKTGHGMGYGMEHGI